MLYKQLFLLNLTELYIEDLNDYKNYRQRIKMPESQSCLLSYFTSKSSTKYKNVVRKILLKSDRYPPLLFKLPILL